MLFSLLAGCSASCFLSLRIDCYLLQLECGAIPFFLFWVVVKLAWASAVAAEEKRPSMIGDDAAALVPFFPFFLFKGRLLQSYMLDPFHLLRARFICCFSFSLLLVTFVTQSICCSFHLLLVPLVAVPFVACSFHLLLLILFVARYICYSIYLLLVPFVSRSIGCCLFLLLLLVPLVALSICCSFQFCCLNAKTDRYFSIAILKGYEPNEMSSKLQIPWC